MTDEPDDDDATGDPPHPLDRLWFHPSELGPAAPTAPARPASRDWGALALAAALGAVATVSVLAIGGAFGGDTTTIAESRLQAASGSAGAVAEIVEQASPSIVGVRVETAVGPAAGSGVALGRRQVLASASLVTMAAGAITVSTPDGWVWRASVLGTDAETDLALLSVQARRGQDGENDELEPAQLGAADDLAVGQGVVAVGVASGDHRWASDGVVSALDRLVVTTTGTQLAGLVETDIEPGDAIGGGALLDANGEVVGVLLRAAPGRAVPVEVARDVAEQLAADGKVHHGWIGVDAADASDRPGGGARVVSVSKDGPADTGGIVAGDVIVRVGNDRVTDMADLVATVARRRPGDPVGVTFWRGNRRLRRDIDLGEHGVKPAPEEAPQ